MIEFDHFLIITWIELILALSIAAALPYIPFSLNTQLLNVLIANVFVCLSLIRLVGMKFRTSKDILLGCMLYYPFFVFAGYNWFTNPYVGAMTPAAFFGSLIPHEYFLKFRKLKKGPRKLPVIKKE